MTPIEKAEQLVERMYNCGELNITESKRCALVVVDEILNSDLLTPQLKRHYVLGFPPTNSELEYWQQVKQEIKKL